MTTHIRLMGFGLPRVGFPDPNDPADTTPPPRGPRGGSGIPGRGGGPVVFTPLPPIQPPIPTTITDYGCPDGSRVRDPSMCPIVGDGSSTSPMPTGGDPGIVPPLVTAPPMAVIGLSPRGKLAIAGLGILAGIAGALLVIHHHKGESSAQT